MMKVYKTTKLYNAIEIDEEIDDLINEYLDSFRSRKKMNLCYIDTDEIINIYITRNIFYDTLKHMTDYADVIDTLLNGIKKSIRKEDEVSIYEDVMNIIFNKTMYKNRFINYISNKDKKAISIHKK